MNLLSFKRPRVRPIRRQRGAVLIVAMIVLVALGLAAISLLRSVDVLGLLSGNLSFQRSALNATDAGVEAAKVKYAALANRTVNDNASCYSATVLPADPRGIPTVLGNATTFATTYPNCTAIAAAGETMYFIVDRQCTLVGLADNKRCILAQTATAGSDTDSNGKQVVWPAFRVTVRVDGPKNTSSYSQVILY